jgi:hypothetical protein
MHRLSPALFLPLALVFLVPRPVEASGGWVCSSGLKNEAGCHYQVSGAKNLVCHGFVRGKSSYAVLSELWE